LPIFPANWRLNAPPHANITPRIAFLCHLIAQELPVASDVAIPWDIAYFIDFLKPKLGEHNAEFLTALVAAVNDRVTFSALEVFVEWQNQPPLPLDTPWPDFNSD
jgi:hypothetical protein